MQFEPWMFAAMEDEGIMDTRTGRINKVAKFLAKQDLNYIGNHNKELLFYERQKEIIREIENLELD